MIITKIELDNFVAETDRVGGPGSPGAADYWRDFAYAPTCSVDVSLDPEGETYFAQMMAVYREISGRELNQAVTELTTLDVNRLVSLESPYADATPADRAIHYLRLAKALHGAALPKGARVLDMGCGWGLSSELLAQLGFKVVAVDINPMFSELVRRRANRLGLDIETQTVAFEEVKGEPHSFDGILFYECFHHAVRPSLLLKKMQGLLKPSGQLILAGEPIQHNFWPNWGLRLDALSVYCIRKFGWFESGWSSSYLQSIVAASGLTSVLYADADPLIGTYLIGSRRKQWDATGLHKLADAKEWWFDGEHLVSGRSGARSTLQFYVPPEVRSVRLEVYNFKPQPLDVKVRIDGVAQNVTLPIGRTEISVNLKRTDTLVRFEFICTPWCPDELLNNGDSRTLGFHLRTLALD